MRRTLNFPENCQQNKRMASEMREGLHTETGSYSDSGEAALAR